MRGNPGKPKPNRGRQRSPRKNLLKHLKIGEKTCKPNGTAGQFSEPLLQLTRKNGVSFAANANAHIIKRRRQQAKSKTLETPQ
jgi:hypothetical protein